MMSYHQQPRQQLTNQIYLHKLGDGTQMGSLYRMAGILSWTNDTNRVVCRVDKYTVLSRNRW